LTILTGVLQNFLIFFSFNLWYIFFEKLLRFYKNLKTWWMEIKTFKFKIKSYFFEPRFHFSRLQFNLVALLLITTGVFVGSYFAAFKIKDIFATAQSSVTKDTDTDFNQGTLSSAEVSGTGTAAVVQIEGGAGPDNTQYVRTITIDNTANSNSLSEYQILIDGLDTASLISAGKMQADCDDIRFTNANGDSLSYSLVGGTCNTSDTEIWVKVDAIAGSSTTTIKMYYGSSSASAGSSEANTFSYSTKKTVAYIVSDQLAASQLDVISLADGNEISDGTSTLSLNNRGTGSFPASELSQGTAIQATKLFHADGNNNITDMVVPVSWAGTEFYYNAFRNNDYFLILSPWGTATVHIYDNGVEVAGSPWTVTSTGSKISINIADQHAIRVSSDIPILVHHYNDSYDTAAFYPASTEYLYGFGSSTMNIGAGPDGANVSWVTSDGTTGSVSLAANTSYYTSMSGSWASGVSARAISSSGGIGMHGLADYDGGECETWLPRKELGTKFGANNPAGYIAIAAPQASTTCTVYNPDGSIYSSSTGGTRTDVNRIGFGTGSTTTILQAGWTMECDKPVYAYYENDSSDSDETNLWTYPMMRQFTYPTPTVSIGDESPALPSSATWVSSTDSNVIDLVWNGGWGDGTDTSTAFSATVADVGTNASITFQMRVASTVAGLSSASYITLGIANSGTSFTKTKADLDSLGLGTGDNRYVQVKATLSSSDGITNPKLDKFTIYYLSDNTPPETNASSIAMKKAAGGASISADGWTNGSSPYFSWTAGSDSQSGLKGYCLYLGTDGTADPATAKGLLGTSPVSTSGTTCQFIINATSIDFATASYKGATWLSSSSDPYYLKIKAVDKQGNVHTQGTASFGFYFDNTPPTNSSFISAPSDFVATKSATFLWPTSGSDAASDAHSGVAGLQYRIGSSGTWYGDSHTGSEDENDLLSNDGSYTTDPTYDYDALEEGNNTIYFRTWDNADNVSSTYVVAGLKINTIAPSTPQNLSVSPSDNTTNSYSFSWDSPSTYTGQVGNITYCYTVNTLPSSTTCTWTSAGTTSLAADAFATQPGTNTFYLVAKDEAGNVNYDTYASLEFNYSGSAPGIPRNVDVADISIKATSNWKLAVSWDEPSDTGAGVSTYKIYRSTTNTTCSSSFSSFSLIGSTAGTSYSDTGLTQQTYYYCVKACDSANNCGAASSTVSGYPDGKYTEPATLTSGPTASSITTKKATISWTTDRNSDSKVQYGTSSGSYFDEEPSKSTQTTDHSITLTNLSAGTTYYYKAKWTDEDGNTGTSSEKSFTTDPAPTVKEVSAKNITLFSAIIQFTSKDATKAKIYYGKTTAFGGTKETSVATTETTYTVELSGLDDGTKYYYKVNLFDSEGEEYEGDIYSFKTLPRPRISNVRLQEIRGAAQPAILVTWDSNTEISSIVTYYPENQPGQARDEINIKLVKGKHKILLKGLFPDTTYILVVKGRDKIGNEARSDSQRFTTATDTRPPVISNLKVEGVIQGVGEEATTQLLVSFNTDEPATSQVEFGEGTGTVYSQKTQEDVNLTFNHLVVISNLTPSRVYHLRAISKDKAGNETKSVDTVTITPKATRSALDLVVSNLSEVFGFSQRR
jgi:hypothetical protein